MIRLNLAVSPLATTLELSSPTGPHKCWSSRVGILSRRCRVRSAFCAAPRHGLRSLVIPTSGHSTVCRQAVQLISSPSSVLRILPLKGQLFFCQQLQSGLQYAPPLMSGGNFHPRGAARSSLVEIIPFGADDSVPIGKDPSGLNPDFGGS